jgi:gamma-glutamyltranspeptidase/glutathione hydrolase
MNRFRKCTFMSLTAVLLCATAASAVTTGQVLKSKNGMVTAANPLAAAAGAEILEKGGNAIDAAIATSLALGVVEPYASSLFGEGYMVVRMADGKTYSIDFRSTVPAKGTYDELKKEKLTVRKIARMPQGACVPGLVAGLEAIYAKGATMKLPELAAPAIRLAEEGFEVNQTFSQICKDNFEDLTNHAPDFLNDGFAWEPGEKFKNPKLAASLKKIVEKGFREFYEGSIADDIESFMAKNGGWITKEDLKNYKAIEREPLKGTYRGYDITVAGLPVGGPRLLENLNIFENYNFKFMGWDDPLRLHIMQETFLLTQEDLRAYIGDPAFNVTSDKGMASKDYAKVRMMQIKMSGATTADEWKNGKSSPGDAPAFNGGMNYRDYLTQQKAAALPEPAETHESASTTHFSVIDRWGNAVAWTQTISAFFGTSYWVDGFFMNNEIGNFWSKPAPEGNVSNMEPGKRVRTTISPMIIEKDGKVRWVLGTPGGGRIVPTLSQMLVDLIDFGMTLEETVKAPKIMSSFNTKNGVSLMEMESGFDAKTVETLQKGFGYTIVTKKYPDLYFGGPNVISVEPDGTLTGVGSIRRGGAAAAPEK